MKKNEMLSEEVLEKVSAGNGKPLDPLNVARGIPHTPTCGERLQEPCTPTFGEQSQAPDVAKLLGALDSTKEIPPLQKEQCNLSLTPEAYSQIQSKDPKKKIFNPGN